LKTIQFFSYSILNDNLGSIKLDKKLIVNTINPTCFSIAKKDKLYKDALISSDILLPDGIGIVLAARLLFNKKIKRITGADIHKYLLENAHNKNQRVFYLGATNEVIKKIQNRLDIEYPQIISGSYSPPFRKEFSEAENNAMVKAVNSFKPNILFVGMTAPKQEKWVFRNKELLDTKIIASVGAVFDFYSGTVKRPSQFWRTIHLEGIIRTIRDPKRQWKKLFYYDIPFYVFIFSAFLSKKINQNLKSQ